MKIDIWQVEFVYHQKLNPFFVHLFKESWMFEAISGIDASKQIIDVSKFDF